ncbi:hypothetical protein ORN12_02975 [Pantoea vagans]|uniref:hypothetical protein n=1 Tax=Pantoea vagans TaxID=470934 RepID=UPI00225387D2|nr:hypothetical protein [Pantoea vagans]MCX3307974.1 hypothetical protein [Pantoea vagans]
MPDNYRIIVITKSGETHHGLMSRCQPEMVNAFIGIAQEDGAWIYHAPGDLQKMGFVTKINGCE